MPAGAVKVQSARGQHRAIHAMQASIVGFPVVIGGFEGQFLSKRGRVQWGAIWKSVPAIDFGSGCGGSRMASPRTLEKARAPASVR